MYLFFFPSSRKEQKEKEKADKDKKRKMDDWAIRSKAREELLAAGTDPAELDVRCCCCCVVSA